MIGSIPTDNKNNPEAPLSQYQPSDEVAILTAKIRDDYNTAYNNLNRSYEEFSHRTVIEEMNAGQRIFNSYVPPRSEDPDESWRAQTVRPLARNKMISIAAHVTANLIYPTLFAQNNKDEEDTIAAEVMSDIMEWVQERADYDRVFLFAVISMLCNPAAIVDVSYVKAVIKARKLAEGGATTQEVLDELNSGIKIGLVPVDELLIANVREFHIQKQRFLIRRRFIDYDEAKSVHGKHENFQYVQPGVRAVYSDADSSFYDIKDDENPTLVEEATYYNRREDCEIVFVNGIYHGKADVNNNPMKHRRTIQLPNGEIATVPVYKFAKSGYEPIDEMRFFYYKSAASKLGPDQDLIDTLYNMVIDGTFLSVMPPVNVFGSEEQDASVVYPGAVNYFSKEAKAETMNLGTNINAGMSTINMVENSMSQSSQDDTRMGMPTGSGRTAFEISRMEQNAQVQLGLFGKMIGFLVKDLSELIIDDIIMHLTVAQMNEIISGEVRMKYNSFLIKEKSENGRKTKKKIEFTDEIMGEVDVKKKQLELIKREKDNERILLVNPYEFARMKYMVTVEANAVIGKSPYNQKILNLEAYDRMIQNPMIDQQSVTRDFLVDTFAEGETEKYMAKQQSVPVPTSQGGQPAPQPATQATNPLAALMQ